MSGAMSQLRREDGFTLVEMLTALVIGSLVMVVAFGLMGFTVKRAGEVAGRVEATQKGRGAMDIVTQHLRSQVCLNSTTPPIASADGNTVSFYADLSDGSAGAPPERHVMTYDASKRTLVETDFLGTRSGSTVIYPSTPTRGRRLSDQVVPENASTPIFRYYAYDSATPPRPTVVLPTPLSTVDRARTVRIEISFRVLPPSSKGTVTASRGDMLMHDDVYVRAADPDDPRDVRPPDPDDPVPPICT
jgi:prepilin-type N-terminal cleavage/methylation domain-containing protein